MCSHPHLHLCVMKSLHQEGSFKKMGLSLRSLSSQSKAKVSPQEDQVTAVSQHPSSLLQKLYSQWAWWRGLRLATFTLQSLWGGSSIPRMAGQKHWDPITSSLLIKQSLHAWKSKTIDQGCPLAEQGVSLGFCPEREAGLMDKELHSSAWGNWVYLEQSMKNCMPKCQKQ